MARLRRAAAAIGIAMSVMLSGFAAQAGAIGGGADDGAAIETFCIELEQTADKRRDAGFLLPNGGGAPGLAPPLSLQRDAADPSPADCLTPGVTVSSGLAAEGLDPDDLLGQGLPAAMGDLTVAPGGRIDLLASDSGAMNAGAMEDSLYASLADYVTVLPGPGAPIARAGPQAQDARTAEDFDPFGLRGSFLDELFDRSLLREFLVSVVEPAIETNDGETFSVFGFGQFRLEYARANASLRLVETQSQVSLSLSSASVGGNGGFGAGVGVGFASGGVGDAGGAGDGDRGGPGSAMSPQELVLYSLGRLFGSGWFYLCLLGGLVAVVWVRSRGYAT